MKIHFKRPRSLKQEWVSERLWCNKGSLAGAAARLRMIARDPSTLPDEADSLVRICSEISTVLFGWDGEARRTRSLEQFEKSNKPSK